MKMREESSKASRAGRNTPKNPMANVKIGRSQGRFSQVDATGKYSLLPDEQPVSTVRDSLYDLIPLGPRELKLINTAAFLRLQEVKQLGFVYRVWPGATHTRYEHSLGVYHLTIRALRSLLQRGGDGGLEGISAASVQALVVASLLHDIGHYPFSHTIEDIGYPVINHEQVGRSIIESEEIATILERDYQLSPARVADLIDAPGNRALSEDDALLRHLLSGALDVDKLDYLPRDARACNVPYGGVDVSRLVASLRVHQDEHGKRCIVVTHKGISPLHSLLHARQEMFDNIYWHHTSRSFQMMLVRAVQDALAIDAITAQQLMGLADAGLLALLTGAAMPASSRALAEDIVRRRPYKVVLEVSPAAGSLFKRLEALFWDSTKRRRVEQELAQVLAKEFPDSEIADHEVLLDISRPEKWEMDVWISFAHPPVGMKPLMKWVEATGLQSDDLARYELHQRRMRIVVAERLRPLLLARQSDVLLPVLEKLL
jgi:HD superfamily phosphohydrolase